MAIPANKYRNALNLNRYLNFNFEHLTKCLQIAQQSTKAVQNLWFFYCRMVCSVGLLA